MVEYHKNNLTKNKKLLMVGINKQENSVDIIQYLEN